LPPTISKHALPTTTTTRSITNHFPPFSNFPPHHHHYYYYYQLTSVSLFARYWFFVVVGMAAAIIILIRIMFIIRIALNLAINDKAIVDSGLSYLYYDTTTTLASLLTRVAVTTPTITHLLHHPTNTTMMTDAASFLLPQAHDLGLEHVLLLNATSHVVWSVNEGSQLVGRNEE